MAKKKPTPSDGATGAYPELPPMPQRGREYADAWRQWVDGASAVIDFHTHEHWRYPSIPILDAAPALADERASAWSWDEWFAGVGPWLQERLDECLASDQCETADAIVAATGCWEFVALEMKRSEKREELIVRYSIELGRRLEEIFARSLDEAVKSGKRLRAKSRSGGKATSRLTDEEKRRVIAYIQRRVDRGEDAKPACEDAVRQLLTGKFPKINRRVESISTSTLQRYWSNRNATR
jgi:hypothetical protein